jgi:hypothetical protein
VQATISAINEGIEEAQQLHCELLEDEEMDEKINE